MTSRKKILVCAYACSPSQGSEPGMGWGFVRALSEYHDLWILTEQVKFQAEIEAELRKSPELQERLHFHFLPKKRRRTLRKIWPPSYYWYYRRWHRHALRLAQQLHAEHRFDLVYQLNMVGYREPGYLWKLDAPFVWGPIGGTANTPWRFLPSLGAHGMLFYGMRNLLNRWQIRTGRRIRKAAAKAAQCDGLIAATSGVQQDIRRFWSLPSHRICEVGWDKVTGQPKRRADDEPLRLAWSGTHSASKGLHLCLRALARLDSKIPWELHVLGSGRRTESWKRLARRLAIAERCRWHGWVPKQQAVETVASAHVMMITSLQDLTSTVLVEAIASGLPVICLNHHGFPDVVTDECGIKIDITTPKRVTEDMAIAIRSLACDESRRFRMAQAAGERAAELLWSAKGASINQILVNACECTDI